VIVAFVQPGDLPADGQPWTALETAVPGSVLTKRNGYNAVDLTVKGLGESADFVVYRYNEDFQGWYPEGPRGTTPTTFGPSLPDNIPIRVSVPFVESRVCVVVQTGGGGLDGVTTSVIEVNR